MKRFAIVTIIAATTCVGLADSGQAQFRIGIGIGGSGHNGHRITIPLNPRHQSQNNRGHNYQRNAHTYQDSGWRRVEQPEHRVAAEHVHRPWEGASHVCKMSDSQYQGVYFEKDNQQYFSDGKAEPQLVSFGGNNHVDDLSARLELLTNELCLELHYNYRHNQGFRHTYKDVYDVYQLAKYIHGLKEENEEGNGQDISRRLEGLDRIFHFVRQDVDDWSRREDRRIGTSSLDEKIEGIQSTVHHLMNDVGVKIAMIVEEPPVPTNAFDVPPLP